MKLEIKII